MSQVPSLNSVQIYKFFSSWPDICILCFIQCQRHSFSLPLITFCVSQRRISVSSDNRKKCIKRGSIKRRRRSGSKEGRIYKSVNRRKWKCLKLKNTIWRATIDKFNWIGSGSWVWKSILNWFNWWIEFQQ